MRARHGRHPLRGGVQAVRLSCVWGSILHIKAVFETDPLRKVATRADMSPNLVSRRAGSLPPGGRQTRGSCTWREDPGRPPAHRHGSLCTNVRLKTLVREGAVSMETFALCNQEGGCWVWSGVLPGGGTSLGGAPWGRGSPGAGLPGALLQFLCSHHTQVPTSELTRWLDARGPQPGETSDSEPPNSGRKRCVPHLRSSSQKPGAAIPARNK